jgi:hypothetical protein
VIAVELGHVHVEAYREHWHPISRYFERRSGARRASTYVDVDAACTRVVIEYRASSFWSRAGRVRVLPIGNSYDDRDRASWARGFGWDQASQEAPVGEYSADGTHLGR